MKGDPTSKVRHNNEAQQDQIKRLNDQVLLLTGKTWGEVMNSYSLPELLRLQAKIMFFESL